MSNIKLVMAVVLAFTLGVVLAGCSGGEERQAKYLERAQDHFDAGNYEKARIDAKNVLQINNKSADAWYLLALIEEKEQNWRGVFGNLNAAVEADEDHLKARIKLAQLLPAAGETERAEEQATRVLDVDPNNADALAAMAAISAIREDIGKAEEYARSALNHDPGQPVALEVLVNMMIESDPEKALDLVESGRAAAPESTMLARLELRVLDTLGRTDEVIDLIKQMVESEPDDVEMLRQAISYYVRKFRVDEGERFLRERVAARPDNPELKLLLVAFLREQRNLKEAIALLQSYLDENPGEFSYIDALGRLYLADGQTGAAVSLYRDALSAELDLAKAQQVKVWLAEIAYADADVEEAEKWVLEVLEEEPENPDALALQARMKMSRGDFRGAIPDLRMALRINPDSIPALLLMAEAQQRDGSISLALDNYREVLSLAPNNKIALFQSARIMAGQGDQDGAILGLEQLLEVAPGNVDAINLLVGLYSSQGRWEEAQSLTDVLSESEGSRALGYLMSANLALRQSRFDQAIDLGEAAIDQNPKMTAALPIIVQGHMSLGQQDQALRRIQSAIKNDPESAQMYIMQGQVYMAMGEVDLAIESFNDVLEVAPENIDAYINLARLHYSKGDSSAVEYIYVRGVESNPDVLLLQLELSNHYLRSGKIDDAIEVLESALKKNPEASSVKNNLAGILIDYKPTEENLDRAQQLTRGFESSSSPAQLDTVGWLHYHLGNYQQAIALLKAAEKAGGVGPEYSYHLGMTYLKRNETELAKEYLGSALQGQPEALPWVEKVREIYNSL